MNAPLEMELGWNQFLFCLVLGSISFEMIKFQPLIPRHFITQLLVLGLDLTQINLYQANVLQNEKIDLNHQRPNITIGYRSDSREKREEYIVLLVWTEVYGHLIWGFLYKKALATH